MMVKMIKQFFELIDPQTNEKSSGTVIKLELETETKKFIDFYSFLNQCPNHKNIFEEHMQPKQTVNMKIDEKKAQKIIADYKQKKEFKEL